MEKKSDAFRYELNMRELFYFLFAKKICPKCGGILDKKKDYEIIKGTNFSQRSVIYKNSRVKHYIYKFRCKRCGTQYTLKELAKKK
ncbi:MAG TPA: hypothetical protein OIM61_09040 [Clostridiaceae bacterium]|nr:hypothetical protein [Clostridiaceae bacterium]